MSAPRLQPLMSAWEKALDRLEEVLARPYSQDNRDIAMMQFILVYELAWKALMLFLGEVGIEANNPRETFRRSYQQGWLNDEQLWLDVIRDRNLVAHTYSERTDMAVYQDIRRFAPEIRRAHRSLKEGSVDLLA